MNKHKQNLLLLLLLCSLLTVRSQTPFVVWPGDANNNGIVNNNDLLQLGLAYNFFGPVRSTVNSNWLAQTATPWNLNFANGLNLAYADCNGDGLINFVYDAFPIYVHYGKTHGTPTPDVYPIGVQGVDAPLAFDHTVANGIYAPGNNLSIPILLGTAALPIDNFYGIAFSIQLDSTLMDVDQVKINFDGLSWINPDNDRIFSTYRASNSRLDVGWVRTDRNNQSGHGSIGVFEFIIIDNVVTVHQPEIKIIIDNIRLIDRFGNETAVAGDTLVLQMQPEVLSGSNLPSTNHLTIAPNPAKDFLYLSAPETIHTIRLFDMTGRLVTTYEPEQTDVKWALPPMPNGLYICEIAVGNVIERRTIFKM